MPKGVRKYIRKEKARIRREVLTEEEQKKKIKELLEKLNIANKKPNLSE